MGGARRALFLLAVMGVSARAFTVRGVEYPQEFCQQLQGRDEVWVRERVYLEIFSRDLAVQKLVLQAQRATEARRTGGKIAGLWTSAANLYRSAANPIAITNGGDGTYVNFAVEHEKAAAAEMKKFSNAIEILGFSDRHLPSPDNFKESSSVARHPDEARPSGQDDYLDHATRLDLARQNFNHAFLAQLKKHEEKLINERNLERDPRADTIIEFCQKVVSGTAGGTIGSGAATKNSSSH